MGGNNFAYIQNYLRLIEDDEVKLLLRFLAKF